MSFNNPLNLQRTVLDITITYTNPFLSKPIIINKAVGEDSIMSLQRPDDQIVTSTTAGGDNDAFMQATLVRGSFSFHPNSPAITELSKVIADMELLTTVIYGTVTVSSALFDDYNLDSFVLTGPAFTGLDISRKLDDYPMPFSFRPPKGYNLSSLVNATGGLIDII